MHRIPSRAAAAAGLLLLVSCSGASLGAAQQAATPHRHMSLTDHRPGTPADTARALDLVRELRSAIAPYRTLEDAAAAGYHPRRDSVGMRGGRLLHVGRRKRGSDVNPAFDPAAPQALLYRRGADGTMRLAGAMFVAPASASSEDLDAMIPLSVAHWHRHVNVCVSPAGERRILHQVSTAEACEAAGGRFRAESRYMIHVMIDGGDDVENAFPQGVLMVPSSGDGG